MTHSYDSMSIQNAPSPNCGGTGGMLDAERAKCSFDVNKLLDMLGYVLV